MKTKIIAVWHVEWATPWRPWLDLAYSYENALELAEQVRRRNGGTCITITGPHQHRVHA